jgi:hypothetical protein
MNQGVEILLARRETNPDELDYALNRFEFSRWGILLSSYKINLDDARTYPIGEIGERFTEEVMGELLVSESYRDRHGSSRYALELAKAMQETKEVMSAHLLRSMYENK